MILKIYKGGLNLPKEISKYLMYPKNKILLAKELISIADDYWECKISEEEVKELTLHYASIGRLLVENSKEINPTVRIAIGKQRAELFKIFLKDYIEK